MKKVAYNEQLVTAGNCIIFICDGQGSVGYTNYMDRDFIGSTTLTVGRNKNLNKYNVINISFNKIPDNMKCYDDYINMIKISV